MADFGSDITSQTTDVPKGSAFQVYRRLIGYALQYKGKLAVSMFFALVIAASFGLMLGSVGAVVTLSVFDPTEMEAGDTDPKDDFVDRIHSTTNRMDELVGWSPADLDTKFLSLVDTMRANPMDAISTVCIVVVILALIIGIARFFQEYFAGSIGASITTDLASGMYANLMRQSVGFFEAKASGEILARFTNDIFMVNRGLAGVFVKLMREPLKAGMFLAIAIHEDPMLTLIGVCALPPVFIVLMKIGKKVRRSVRKSLQRIASLASIVNETIGGIQIVKGYSMEAYETGRVQKEIINLRKFLFKIVKLDAATAPITEFMLILGIVAFVMFSAYRLESGSLDAGSMVALYIALAMMLDPIRKLSSVNNMIQTSVASAERVFEFIDMEPEIMEVSNAKVLTPLEDTIRFENVHFSYDGKAKVLQGIDLEIKKGEMVALVGFSGAGKSTLVKLLPRFYDIQQGKICFDGQDISEATFDSLRSQISMVTQETILFADSIRKNIAYGHEHYTDERVKAAADAANASEFVDKLPNGYESVLGETGANLSGGQRQRLAIARAIIKDPAILILDEATSSLDSESERLIQEALDQFVEGRTTFVIAHRLSTIQRADRILVMEDGRIAEDGTHDALLAQGGIYRRLYDTQFGNQEER